MYPLMHGRYFTDILKMCINNFNGDKNNFDKLTGFSSAHCGGYTVSPACSQFLVRTEIRKILQFLS